MTTYDDVVCLNSVLMIVEDKADCAKAADAHIHERPVLWCRQPCNVNTEKASASVQTTGDTKNRNSVSVKGTMFYGL